MATGECRLMTDFEIVLLQMVARGNGQWSWHTIANRMPVEFIPQAPEMMATLQRLLTMGYVTRQVIGDGPMDRWELTPAGRQVLDRLENT
jgi:PadR family transcriptional regulator PadR